MAKGLCLFIFISPLPIRDPTNNIIICPKQCKELLLSLTVLLGGHWCFWNAEASYFCDVSQYLFCCFFMTTLGFDFLARKYVSDVVVFAGYHTWWGTWCPFATS